MASRKEARDALTGTLRFLVLAFWAIALLPFPRAENTLDKQQLGGASGQPYRRDRHPRKAQIPAPIGSQMSATLLAPQ
jgi:hypothetical protein